MSYWIGIAQAIKEEEAERFQAGEAQKARDYQKSVREEDRAYGAEQKRLDREFQLGQMREARKVELAKLRIKSGAPSGGSGKGKAVRGGPEHNRDLAYLKGRLGDTLASERGQSMFAAALADPVTAAKFASTIAETEAARAEKDFTDAITGEQILEGFEWYGEEAVERDILSTEEFMTRLEESDMSTDEYLELYGEAIKTPSQSAFGVSIDPKFLRIPSEKKLDYQVSVFDDAIAQAAEAQILELSAEGKEAEAASFQQMLNGFGTDRPATQALRDTFGPDAMELMLRSGDPFLTNLEDNFILQQWLPKPPAPPREEQKVPPMPLGIDSVGLPTPTGRHTGEVPGSEITLEDVRDIEITDPGTEGLDMLEYAKKLLDEEYSGSKVKAKGPENIRLPMSDVTSATPRPGPQKGQVVDGWEFLGGDPGKKDNWKKK